MLDERQRLRREHAISLINDHWSAEAVARLCGQGIEIYTIKFDPIFDAWAVWFNGSWQGPGYETIERAKQAARRMCLRLPAGYRMKWEQVNENEIVATIDRNEAWVKARVEIAQSRTGSEAHSAVRLLHRKGIPAEVVDRGKEAVHRWGVSVLKPYAEEAKQVLQTAMAGPQRG